VGITKRKSPFQSFKTFKPLPKEDHELTPG